VSERVSERERERARERERERERVRVCKSEWDCMSMNVFGFAI
jgi:hypothetical protein